MYLLQNAASQLEHPSTPPFSEPCDCQEHFDEILDGSAIPPAPRHVENK